MRACIPRQADDELDRKKNNILNKHVPFHQLPQVISLNDISRGANL